MPKIICKCGYLSNKNNKRSGYIEYIAKRDGTTMNNIKQIENYISYIAERPRVFKEGTHGLFSSNDEIPNLSKVKEEIKHHEGNIWTAIISLTREDAYRLGYDTIDSWRNVINANHIKLSNELKIHPNNFRWYAAFHDEKHHPHIHLVMYSTNSDEGYLSKQSINSIRSAFARDIFHDELLHIYQKQILIRDSLKLVTKEQIKNRIININQNIKSNKRIDELLISISNKLKDAKGKKTYAYIPKSIKHLVDECVIELSKDSTVSKLLDSWYEQKREIHSTYSNQEIEIRNLSDLQEFKSIKNTIIKLSQEINYEHQEIFHVSNGDITEVSDNTISTHTSEYNSDYSYSDKIDLSIKLIQQVSKMFHSSMIHECRNYQVDQKLIKEIMQIKIKLGMEKF